jgi:hypothetical protein
VCANLEVAGTRKMHQNQLTGEIIQFVAAKFGARVYRRLRDDAVSFEAKEDSALKMRTWTYSLGPDAHWFASSRHN